MATSAQHRDAVVSASSRSNAGAAATESRKVSFQQPSGSDPSRSSSSAHLSSSSSRSATATSSSQAYSAYSGATRRHSLFGTEDRVVLDIGSRYSKFGFSGEPRPRAIVPSLSFSQPSTSYLRLDTSSPSLEPYVSGETLWDLDFERCADDQLRRGKRALLLAQLTQLLRNAFTQHLMVDPKQRKVLVVENPMLPNSVKEMLLKVLFNNLQVPSVSFVPAPLLSLLAVGRITGLVLEVGFLESTLTPVFYGRPLESHSVSSPRAGKRLNERLRLLLLRYGKFVASQNSLQDCSKPLRERTHAIDPALLTDDRVEQIKAKALFVRSDKGVVDGLEELFADLELESMDAPAESTRLQERSAAELRKRCSSSSTATPFTFAVSPDSVDPRGSASLIQSVAAPTTTSSSSLTAAAASTKAQVSGVIAIPGWVRERAAELLLEKGDDDDPGLVEMTVTAISKLPIDLRRPMCENVLVSGGTVMLPGFGNRFRTQLAMAVEQAERPGGQLSIERHARRLKANLNGEETDKAEGKGLHSSVAVLNDPWPDMSQSSSRGKKAGAGGTAPAFAANLLPWMGASLAGALKTTVLNAVSREAYDEATKPTQGAAETKADTEEPGKEKDKEAEKQTRPAMPAPNKRGSFVGVVGGLETGAYGGLAAVSRHLIGVPGSSPVKGSAAARPAPESGGNDSE